MKPKAFLFSLFLAVPINAFLSGQNMNWAILNYTTSNLGGFNIHIGRNNSLGVFGDLKGGMSKYKTVETKEYFNGILKERNLYLALSIGLSYSFKSFYSLYLGWGYTWISTQMRYGEVLNNIKMDDWFSFDFNKKEPNILGGIVFSRRIPKVSFLPSVYQFGFNVRPPGMTFGIGYVLE